MGASVTRDWRRYILIFHALWFRIIALSEIKGAWRRLRVRVHVI